MSKPKKEKWALAAFSKHPRVVYIVQDPKVYIA